MIIGSRRDQAVGPKRWKFLGLLEYLRHYPETQLDIRGQLRKVWLFEFRIHHEPSVVPIQQDFAISATVLSSARESDQGGFEDRQVITEAPATDYEKKEAAEIEAVRSRLLAVSPQQFEYLIKNVLLLTGFERVSVTKYSQDGGIDINAFAGQLMWPIRNLLVQVQAKRWLHTVGRKEVAELRGSLQPFSRGTVVTTSHFSRAAIAEAQETGKNPIVLVDGYAFASLARAIDLKWD